MPSSRAQAIATEAAVPLRELSGQVARLLRLCAVGPRADPAQPVAWARQFALDRLLWEHLATPEAHEFVEERLGSTDRLGPHAPLRPGPRARGGARLPASRPGGEPVLHAPQHVPPPPQAGDGGARTRHRGPGHAARGARRAQAPPRAGGRRATCWRGADHVAAATRARLTSNDRCRVDWRRLRLRLRIVFANFGGHGPGQTTCISAVGRPRASRSADPGSAPGKGCASDSDLRPSRQGHPSAELRQGAWWLRTAVSPFGDERVRHRQRHRRGRPCPCSHRLDRRRRRVARLAQGSAAGSFATGRRSGRRPRAPHS